MKYQESKKIVREYFKALDNSDASNVSEVLKQHMSSDYLWRGVYPFREQNGIDAVVSEFWSPLMKAVTNIQRRQDIFIGGTNEISGEQWVMSMGHFMGNFTSDWLGIRATNKMISLRYAEFSCVENGKISKTGLFIDIIGFMIQAGAYPLPPATGQYFVYPGPKNHNGLLFEDAPEEDGVATLALINKMIDDLSALNESGSMGCPPEVLAKSWSKNMIWYGPGGIGASYTIPGYQRGHQLPFRANLTDKKFNGHVCRFAEGSFGCFFGWPNLTNRPIGGFLGLPSSNKADMQVVDVYSREGDELVENWVLIDIPYWLKQQGIDVLERTKSILNPEL